MLIGILMPSVAKLTPTMLSVPKACLMNSVMEDCVSLEEVVSESVMLI